MARGGPFATTQKGTQTHKHKPQSPGRIKRREKIDELAVRSLEEERSFTTALSLSHFSLAHRTRRRQRDSRFFPRVRPILRSKKRGIGEGGWENAPTTRRFRFGQQTTSAPASSRASSPLPIVAGRPESNILRAYVEAVAAVRVTRSDRFHANANICAPF